MGTDFTIPMKNALLTAKEEEKEVKAILFITDLDAAAPDFEYIKHETEMDELPPVIFVTDSENKEKRERFEKNCKGNAVVFYYEDGLVADIQELQDNLDKLKMEHDLNKHLDDSEQISSTIGMGY